MGLPIGQQTTGKEFWRSHIESAEKFNGTNKEYCLEHGLNPGSFSGYRKKLGYSRPRKSPQTKVTAFSQVQVSQPEVHEHSSPNLPEAKWLAEFIKALVSLS